MTIFEDEDDLLETLEQHDALLVQCASGVIGFQEFLSSYADFPLVYALDGHESDSEERTLLERHAARVHVHLDFADEILFHLCSEDDQDKKDYIQAGRFGSKGAMPRIRDFVHRRLSPSR
jgi:hypothetical protein